MIEKASPAENTTLRWTRNGYLLTTDRTLLNVDVIHAYLAETSYWAKGRSRETVQRSMDNSLCFGVIHGTQLVGFARVITDYAVHAYVADVFVLPEHRGRGLGKWLVEGMLAHPQLKGIPKWSLDTRDAQGLYAQFGFEPSEPGRHMGLRRTET